LPLERLHEGVPPTIREEAKPPGDHPIMALERPLLRAALDQHVHELFLPAVGDVHLGELVGRLLEPRRRHDGEVDLSSQVNQVRVRQVLDEDERTRRRATSSITSFGLCSMSYGLLFIFHSFIVIVIAVTFAVLVTFAVAIFLVVFIAVVFAENFGPNTGPSSLVIIEVGIERKRVKVFLLPQGVVVESNFEGDLIVLLHEVELRRNGRVAGPKPVLAQLQQRFDLVLDAAVRGPHFALVKDRPKTLRNGPDPHWTYLEEGVSHRLQKGGSDLDRVVRYYHPAV
jgi:hypothetical protein